MDSTGTGTGTGAGAGAIDKFLHAIENATIGACQAWSADASLDATVPNWRLHASGADAIRAEYARWFADPGHFDEPNRHRIAGGYDGDGRASELIEYTQRDPRLLAAECLWLDSVHAEVAEHPHGQRLHGPIKPRSWPRRQTKPTASGNSALGRKNCSCPVFAGKPAPIRRPKNRRPTAARAPADVLALFVSSSPACRSMRLVRIKANLRSGKLIKLTVTGKSDPPDLTQPAGEAKPTGQL